MSVSSYGNGLFEEMSIFSVVFYVQWKICQWKISPYGKYIIITKQKVKILQFCMFNKLHK